jgi:hypothetical protein
MKPGPNSKRSRGRGNPRRPNNNNINNNNNNPRNQLFESNGPEVRIRGTVNQVLEKYLALARDSSSSGDYVSAENFFQHAEHYYRILSANGGVHNGLQRIPGQQGQGLQPPPQSQTQPQIQPQMQPQRGPGGPVQAPQHGGPQHGGPQHNGPQNGGSQNGGAPQPGNGGGVANDAPEAGGAGGANTDPDSDPDRNQG